MTDKQIYKLIEKNRCSVVQINDTAGHLVHEIFCSTPEAAITELEDMLPEFKSYKRLQLKAVEKKGTPWARGYQWSLEFEKTEETIAQANNNGNWKVPPGYITPADYIGMFTKMMTDQNALQVQLLEKKLEFNNMDPTKWLPMIQVLGPALGLKVGGIAAPPGTAAASTTERKELHFVDDVDTSKLNPEQMMDLIANKLQSISTKVSGPQMLRLLSTLEKNKSLKENVDKISKLLQAIIDKPHLLDQAMAFI